MFERLKYLYIKGIATKAHLTNAVNKGWITEEQKQEIMEVH